MSFRRVVERLSQGPPASRALAVLALLVGAAALRGAERPNVLFIAVDDLNDWVGPLGGHPQARTPHLDRLAARGTLFANAHCAYSLCNPSRASVMSGLLPSTSGVFGNQQDWRKARKIRGRPTLPQYFRMHGYWTGAAGKIYHANHGGPQGALTGGHGGRRGFNHPPSWVERYPSLDVQIPDLVVRTGQNWNGLDIWHWDWGPIDHPDEATADGRCVAWAIEQLKREHTRPFFLALGIYAPHGPWYCPRPYFEKHPVEGVQLPLVKGDDLDDVPDVAKGYTRSRTNYHRLVVENGLYEAAVQAYLAQITFADAMVGRVLGALNESRYRSNTIVCLWSDHGWYLGEKRRWHKGGLWEEATRVPLIIAAPGRAGAGSRCERAVSLVDLYPTLVDLCGLPPRGDLDGESLVPLLGDPSARRGRPVITVHGGGARASYAVRTDRWRYIRYYTGDEELYDHRSDPQEWTNLAGHPEHAALKARLARWIPEEFASASRPEEEIRVETTADGVTRYHLEDGDRLGRSRSPRIAGRALRVRGRLTPAHPTGVVVAQGGAVIGWALYLRDGKLVMEVRQAGKTARAVSRPVPAGPLRFAAELAADGAVTVTVNGQSSSAKPIGPIATRPAAGLSVGAPTDVLDRDLRIVGFTGELHELVVEVKK